MQNKMSTAITVCNAEMRKTTIRYVITKSSKPPPTLWSERKLIPPLQMSHVLPKPFHKAMAANGATGNPGSP